MNHSSNVMRTYEYIFNKYMRKIIEDSNGSEMLMTFEKDKIPAKKYGGKHRNWTDEQKMEMKREVIADKGIWVAKKRYILNTHQPLVALFAMNGKGDSPRNCFSDSYREGYDRIFGKEKKVENSSCDFKTQQVPSSRDTNKKLRGRKKDSGCRNYH